MTGKCAICADGPVPYQRSDGSWWHMVGTVKKWEWVQCDNVEYWDEQTRLASLPLEAATFKCGGELYYRCCNRTDLGRAMGVGPLKCSACGRYAVRVPPEGLKLTEPWPPEMEWPRE